MERELIEKAKTLVEQIDKYSGLQKLLFKDDVRFGVAASPAYVQYYLDLKFDSELNEKLITVTKEYVGQKLPELQKQLNEL